MHVFKSLDTLSVLAYLSSGPEFEPRARQNLLNRKRGSIAQSLSLSPMTEILLKRMLNRKSSSHPYL